MDDKKKEMDNPLYNIFMEEFKEGEEFEYQTKRLSSDVEEEIIKPND